MQQEYIGWFVPQTNIFVESTSTKRKSSQAINTVIAEYGKRTGIEPVDFSNPHSRKYASSHMIPCRLVRLANGYFNVQCKDTSVSGLYSKEHITVRLLGDATLEYITVYVGENHSGIFFKEPNTITYYGLDYKDAFSKILKALDNDCRYVLMIHEENGKDIESYMRLKQFVSDMYFVSKLDEKHRKKYDL